MQLTAAIFPLLVASLATATSWFSGSQTVMADDDLKVPGENPLTFCNNVDKYSLTINYVDLTPNPPLPGKTLTIKAAGNFTAEVVEGATVYLTLKYGLITLIRKTADLCEQIKNIDEECPLEGAKVLTKTVELPSTIPPGKYSVTADVHTAAGDPITCLNADVQF